MAKILKFWHQWSWALHAGWVVVVSTAFVVTYQAAIASTQDDVRELKRQHQEENLKERMAVQERTASDIRDDVKDIKAVQGKIFDRINQIADRRNR